ncbi:MAG: hypothetical protein ACK4PK_08840 [Alphaproteobacteria bacterium]
MSKQGITGGMTAAGTDFSNETVSAAVERKSLSGVFNAFTRETTQAFPEIAGHFAILNIPEDMIHMSIDPAKAGFNSQKELHRYLGDLMVSYENVGTSVAHFDGKHNLALLVYNGPHHMQMFADPVRDNLKNIVGIMDHELGHMLVEGAYYYSNRHSPTEIIYAETGADIYAGLRHLSRFMGSADDIDLLAWQRTKGLLEHGDSGHYTSFGLERLAELARLNDLSGVPARQAVELAARIASETSPHESVVNGIVSALPAIRSSDFRRTSPEEALRPLAEKILSGQLGYHSARTADAYMSPYLMEQVIMNGKAPVLLNGPYWDKVRIALFDMNEKTQAQGVLHGINAKPKTPAR